jgi:DnaJ-related protein SCJ1
MNVEITLKEALLGFKMEFEHLDGHKVSLVRENGKITQPGEVQKIVDEGMPKYGMPSENGDLLVTYRIKNPEILDDGQKTMLR